jgi:TPP-dependent pyruvate/acetoin dehydrogenase alpha subunit
VPPNTDFGVPVAPAPFEALRVGHDWVAADYRGAAAMLVLGCATQSKTGGFSAHATQQDPPDQGPGDL